jgi:hypothetical protein
MRLRKVESEKEMENVIDDLITTGYTIKSQGATSAKLKKAEYGGLIAHIIIFILFGWWTFFIANILYAGFKYLTGDEVLVKMRNE